MYACALVLLVLLVLVHGKAFIKPKRTGTPCDVMDENGNARSVKILLFVSNGMVSLFVNWLIHYDAICPNKLHNVEVVCMDAPAHASLATTVGVKCSPNSFDLAAEMGSNGTRNDRYSGQSHFKSMPSPGLSRVWMKRMQIARRYIESGTDVIMSDVDALWMRTDIFKDLSEYARRSDIVSSRAFWPHHIREKWGACLCMGFIYMKSGKFTSALFTSMLKYLIGRDERGEVLDDQVAVNQILDQWAIKWWNESSPTPPSALPPAQPQSSQSSSAGSLASSAPPQIQSYNLSVSNSETVDHGDVMYGNQRYTVTLLPHSQYVRQCHKTKNTDKTRMTKIKRSAEVVRSANNAYVAHCTLRKGNGRAKETTLAEYGLWKLRRGWADEGKDFLENAWDVSFTSSRSDRRDGRDGTIASGEVSASIITQNLQRLQIHS
jgi:hypothetical protein